MTPLNLFRLTQPLVLAAIVAALAVPTVALAGANHGYGPRDGWYTYATSVTKSDRNAASDSNGYGPRDGWYTQAVSLTDAAKALRVDGRSPDTLDAAQATQLQAIDGRSPDTLDAASAPQLQVADGRSPDTLDAASAPQPIEIVQPGGFDWADAGIGAIVATLMTLLVGGTMLLLARFNRRQRVRAT